MKLEFDVYLYKCGIRLILYFHHMGEARLKEMVEGLNYWLNGCFQNIGRRLLKEFSFLNLFSPDMTFFLMFFALSSSNSHFYTALIIQVGTCDECVPVLFTSPSLSLFSQFLSTLGITFLTCLHI